MSFYLRRLDDEARFLLVEPVEDFQDRLGVGLHHVDEEVGALEVVPVGVEDVEGLGLQRLVVVGVPVDVHLQAVFRVNLLHKTGQALKKRGITLLYSTLNIIFYGEMLKPQKP